MHYLFIFFVILTTAKAHDVSENDSCYSTEDITVPYTLWVNTNVIQSNTINVTVKNFTSFYDVIEVAGERDPANYG
jgi:hypothetical protein